MPEWSTACVDWAERIREGRSIIPPPIFPEEAEAGLAVMRDLRIVDAPGSPRMADACGQWIFDLAATIFGAYDAQSGRRLIKEWFVMLPKKNFKSGLAASIMLTCLVRNWRRSAEFTILAPTKEVADNPDGSSTGITLIVRGTFAPEVVAWNSGVAEKFLNEQRAAQRRGKAPKAKTIDEMEAQNIEGAVVRVAGWEGVRQPFSADQLRAALKRNPHWAVQIIEESDSLGNFGATSASSSEAT